MSGKYRVKLLDDGYIPEKTECPFTSKCGIKKSGNCKHLGIAHEVKFSCAVARSFD